MGISRGHGLGANVTVIAAAVVAQGHAREEGRKGTGAVSVSVSTSSLRGRLVQDGSCYLPGRFHDARPQGAICRQLRG